MTDLSNALIEDDADWDDDELDNFSSIGDIGDDESIEEESIEDESIDLLDDSAFEDEDSGDLFDDSTFEDEDDTFDNEDSADLFDDSTFEDEDSEDFFDDSAFEDEDRDTSEVIENIANNIDSIVDNVSDIVENITNEEKGTESEVNVANDIFKDIDNMEFNYVDDDKQVDLPNEQDEQSKEEQKTAEQRLSSDAMIVDHTDEVDDEETARLYADANDNETDDDTVSIDELEEVDDDLIDNNELLEDSSEPQYGDIDSEFIDDSGSIVVQNLTDERENGFEFKYIEIDKIAITNRIRKLESVEALVQSIKSTGLLEPLTVAPTATEGLYVLLDGLRRIQACARVGKKRIPCIVNNMVSTPEIPIIEALYNHNKSYSLREQISYIEYLEKQKGISNPTMIEYLLQMNSGDYTKLKDILNDNDDDIVSKLYDGTYDIATAFKKLEQRRKKESAEEKEKKTADKVYSDEKESGIDVIQGAGEEAEEDGSALTPEQLKELTVNVETLDDDADDMNLSETVAEDDKLEGFEKHQQTPGHREYIDPAIKKATLIRDKGTCQCCKRGGPQMADSLDLHHIIPCFLQGVDSVDNSIMLCLTCHRMVHLYSTGDLTIDKALYTDKFADLSDESKDLYQNEEIFENEKSTYKRIIYLGGKIRQGISAKGMNREQYKKEHSNQNIGRRMPGKNASQSGD